MVRSKAPAKKQQIDFKKIKRKLGRKLPPQRMQLTQRLNPKILENYKDIIIQINHFYAQDKSNLKVVLSGLTHCLSLLPCDESNTESHKKEIVRALINCFQDFIPLLHSPRGLDAQSLIDCVHHILCSICYAIKSSIRDVSGGPFASLLREAQELALCFLYYFTIENPSSLMLRAIVSCCLYEQLEPAVLNRIVEIIHTAYRDGYIKITAS